MPSYATIMLNAENIPAILDSISDLPGGKARFFHACLVYNYTGEDLYFVRGNYKQTGGMNDFSDHIFTREELDETFIHDLKPKAGGRTPKGKYVRNPDAMWFVVKPKTEHKSIETDECVSEGISA